MLVYALCALKLNKNGKSGFKVKSMEASAYANWNKNNFVRWASKRNGSATLTHWQNFEIRLTGFRPVETRQQRICCCLPIFICDSTIYSLNVIPLALGVKMVMQQNTFRTWSWMHFLLARFHSPKTCQNEFEIPAVYHLCIWMNAISTSARLKYCVLYLAYIWENNN